jgi:perosamine synthetase
MTFRIPVAEPDIGPKELQNVVEAVKSGWVSSKGRFIRQFEEEFANYVGVRHAVATSSGTASLHLALSAIGIGSGNEVIVPTLTFAAVANSVIHTRAKPVLVDSHIDYWCIDPLKIEQQITRKTKAIIPVHLYGHPCDMDRIRKLAYRHGLYVIEDCAEAHGAEYKTRRVGSFSDIACFSFYGNKTITTGEGGMCLTNSEKLANKMRILRDHGMRSDKRYWHEVVGFNYRLTNLQAALGVAQLGRMDEFVERKRRLAKRYQTKLKHIRGILTQPEMSWAKCVFWLYSVLVTSDYGLSRDELQARLLEAGVETRRFFYPLHQMPLYRPYSKGTYLNADRLAAEGINLPSSVKLSNANVQEVANLIHRSQQRF